MLFSLNLKLIERSIGFRPNYFIAYFVDRPICKWYKYVIALRGSQCEFGLFQVFMSNWNRQWRYWRWSHIKQVLLLLLLMLLSLVLLFTLIIVFFCRCFSLRRFHHLLRRSYFISFHRWVPVHTHSMWSKVFAKWWNTKCLYSFLINVCVSMFVLDINWNSNERNKRSSASLDGLAQTILEPYLI